MGNNYLFQNEISETQQQLDFFLAPLSVPVGKLDADQYSAEDMDGVTESLFGSGNLSFLTLQSGQSNDAMALNNAFAAGGDDLALLNAAFPNGFAPSSHNISLSSNDFGSGGTTILSNALHTSPVDTPSNNESNFNDGYLSHTSQGAIGGSDLSSGNMGTMFADYTNMGGSMVGDSYIGGIRNLLVNGGNNSETFIENIFQGDVTEVVNSVTQNITNAGDVINQVVNNEITETVTNVINNVLGDTVTNITNNLTDLLTGEGHIAVNLDANLLNTVDAHVGILIEDSIAADVNVNATTAHLNDLVQNLTRLHIPLVADLGANIGLNLLNGGIGTDNAAGDTDLVINGLDQLGIQLPNIALDPLEALIGDIDITINLPTNLLSPATLIEGVQGLLQSVDNLNIATVPEILEILSPEGVQGALGIEILDQVLNQDLGLAVGDVLGGVHNLVESLTSPIDPVLNDALNLLGGDTNILTGVLGSVWTETGIGNGGLFGDIVQGGNVGDMLPDPIGAIAEGLGALDIQNLLHNSGGGLGGLFG